MYIFVLGISGFVILLTMLKTHHFVKSFILSAMQGLISLFSVNFIGEFLNIHIAFNLFSAIVCSVGSLPGVIFLIVSDLVCKI